MTSLLPRPILVALNKGDRAAAGLTARGMSRVLTGQEKRRHFGLVRLDPERPSPTNLGDTGCTTAGRVHPYEVRKLSIAEIKALASYPKDPSSWGATERCWHGSGTASCRS